jgi:hypothetical protein
MNASQLQSLNDLIRNHVWRLDSVHVDLVDENWIVKIIADSEQSNYQIDRLGLVEEFEPEF